MVDVLFGQLFPAGGRPFGVGTALDKDGSLPLLRSVLLAVLFPEHAKAGRLGDAVLAKDAGVGQDLAVLPAELAGTMDAVFLGVSMRCGMVCCDCDVGQCCDNW